MKNSLLKGFLVFLTMFFSGFAFSQSISGKVKEGNSPLPGASVTVKGTTNSQQTDLDGNFTIKNVATDAVLVISYIGLETQEVKVAGKSTINVSMKSSQEQLKEVMVIGYGSVKKKDATGAVDQISSKKFDNVASVSPAQILQGKVAGVQVTQASGEPGSAVTLRVRGSASFRSGSNPLYVVDGVPLEGGDLASGGADIQGLGSSSARNPLNFINQNDIESITVLKDASSTAIYGARGANGVIMITTKKGTKGNKPEANYSSSVQFSSLSTKFKMLSADEYVAGGKIGRGGNYNWEDAILRNAISTNHDLSMSSSGVNSSTRFSIGYSETEGIVKNTGISKYTASLSQINSFFNDALKIEGRVNYTNLNDQTTLITNNSGFIGSIIGNALYWNPTYPIYDNSPDGYYNPGYSADPTNPSQGSDTYLNPVQILDGYSDRTKTNKILGSLKTGLKLTKDLRYQFLLGFENSSSERKNQLLPTVRIQDISVDGNRGFARIISRNAFNKTLEHTLTYVKSINDNFSFDLLGGYSFYQYNNDGNNINARGFNEGQTNLIDNINGGKVTNNNAGSFRNKVDFQSFYARANATLYKNLLLTATIRRDGSSKFGENNKYGNFPSAAIAYKLINDKDGILNNIKVRTSYGVTGNSDIPVNASVNKLNYNNGAQTVVNNGNPNLKWETTSTLGAGIDFELLKNKLTGSLDYFSRETSNLIYAVPSAATQPSGGFSQYQNFDQGVLAGKGLEVTLNYNVINNNNFRWDVSANASFLKSKIKDFPEVFEQFTGEISGPGLSGAYAQSLKNGLAMYSYYLQEFVGYDANGKSLYLDANGGTTGSPVAKYTGKQALPKTNIGFNTNFGYKNWDLGASFYGAFGHYIYNNTANALLYKGSYANADKNVTPEVLASAQGNGDTNPVSTKYLEKGDFLRLGNLTLGYTFNNPFLEKLHLKAAKFFVNGSNLFVITKYSGFDPEVDISKPINGVPSSGIDYLSYPKAKTFSFGINVTF